MPVKHGLPWLSPIQEQSAKGLKVDLRSSAGFSRKLIFKFWSQKKVLVQDFGLSSVFGNFRLSSSQQNDSKWKFLRFPPKIRFRDFLLNWFHFRSKSRFFVSVGAETFVRSKDVRKSGKVRIRTILTNRISLSNGHYVNSPTDNSSPDNLSPTTRPLCM